MHQGAIELTQEGRRYAASNLIERKEIFRTQALERCPALAQKSNGRMNREFFVDAMEQSYGVEEAERQVDTLIEWGRYGEIRLRPGVPPALSRAGRGAAGRRSQRRLTPRLRRRGGLAAEDFSVHGACTHHCYDTCSLLVHVQDGVIRRIEGDPSHPLTRGFLC